MANKTALLLISDGSEEMEAVITADVLRRGEVCKIIIRYNLKYTIYYILYIIYYTLYMVLEWNTF